MTCCLGEGVYTAQLRETGTGAEVETAEAPEGSWQRLLSDTATAEATFRLGGTLERICCDLFDAGPQLPCLEMWLWRQTDTTEDLVFVGPVVSVIQESDEVVVTADDNSRWLSEVTLGDSTHNNVDMAEIAAGYAVEGFTQNPQALADVEWFPSGVLGDDTVVAADEVFALDRVDDITEDVTWWTAVNRLFVVGGQGVVTDCDGLRVRLTDTDFTSRGQSSAPTIGYDRDVFATRVVVVGDNVTGVAERPGDACPSGGPKITKRVDKNELKTQAAVDQLAASTLAGAGTVGPVVDASRVALSADLPIDVGTLVPGNTIDIALANACSPVASRLVVARVEGSWSGGSDKIGVGLQTSASGGDRSDLGDP